MREIIVYLAGGFHSGWQNRITTMKMLLPAFHFIDPSASKDALRDPYEYVPADLAAIRRCDILFAYMEKANPAGQALALEIGYAKALGKMVIFVNEVHERRWHMVDTVADTYLDNLAEGERYLLNVGRLLAG